ncbi:GNAT family N-acetyltransferase [Methylocystis sp. B8]|uniref:GNAT family N-acetyltransferase n=1 Tax=Methylocystis sp. B8 TaxID=544938 RepID=UPI0010FEEB0F|nr:GNAT family N-acetyltransferase [Methylocystis sp. B8]TLG77600.1 GNAT family N-acetyltransferase [Methylocystis sp. B8]
MRVEKDNWLSDALGVSSWKALGMTTAVSPAEIQAGLFDRAGQGAAFFSTRIPTRDVVVVTNATRAGFSVVDVNVTFDWENRATCASGIDKNRNSIVKIEIANAGDAAAIEAIASHCFTFSRFHLDPAIGLDRANEVKRQWARNACRGRASVVYVVRQQNAVTGFLAVLENKSSRGTDAIIDLVGVDAAHQGRGAGQALGRMFVDQWRDRAVRLRVGTQISNIPAMRLYEAIGFRVAETSYVLHAHVKNGAIAA